MSPRGRKPGTKNKVSENSLLIALKFIASAQRAIGSIEQTHCRLAFGWAMASNGIISAAHPIQEQIETCPHTFRLIDSLEQAPEAINLTQMDENRLSVRSGDFQAITPCVLASSLPQVTPDTAIALCDDRLKQALEITGALVVDGAQKLINASIQLTGQGTAIASDGIVILEAYHGIGLPPLMVVPKALVTALGKAGKPIVRLGCSDSSLTIWYENGAWIKTQLYPQTDELPDLYKWLNLPSQAVPIPKNLFMVAKRLQFFAADGMIYFNEKGGWVKSTIIENTVFADNQIEGIPAGIAFNIKSLLSIEKYCKTVHFLAGDKLTLFFGDNVRGALVTDVA